MGIYAEPSGSGSRPFVDPYSPVSGYDVTGVSGTQGASGCVGVSGSCGASGYSSSSIIRGLTYATWNSNELPILLEDFKIIELKKERKDHTFMSNDNSYYLYE